MAYISLIKTVRRQRVTRCCNSGRRSFPVFQVSSERSFYIMLVIIHIVIINYNKYIYSNVVQRPLLKYSTLSDHAACHFAVDTHGSQRGQIGYSNVVKKFK